MIATFVQVPPDSTGKKVHNALLDVGGDPRVAQITPIGDPDNPDAVAKVRDASPQPSDYGVVVRQAPPNYDSGLAALPTVSTVVVGTTVKVRRLFLSNLTDQVQLVTVTNGAGTAYLNAYGLPAAGILNLDMGGMAFTGGVKWLTPNANTVNGQLVGDQ